MRNEVQDLLLNAVALKFVLEAIETLRRETGSVCVFEQTSYDFNGDLLVIP